jgi:hypothetical protein
MRSSSARWLCIAGVVLPSLCTEARADEVRSYAVQDRTETTGPNRTMLHTGVWTLGLSYVPAIIVAAESERHGDKNLYLPVAGPWMDLASRGACPPNTRCTNETTNKALLVIDGIFQGVGALDIVGSFLLPETRTVTTRASKKGEMHVGALSFRLTPVRMNSGYGLSAIGSF